MDSNTKDRTEQLIKIHSEQLTPEEFQTWAFVNKLSLDRIRKTRKGGK